MGLILAGARWLVVYAVRGEERREIGRFPFREEEWDGGREYETERQEEAGDGTLVVFEAEDGEGLLFARGPGFGWGERVVVMSGDNPLKGLMV